MMQINSKYKMIVYWPILVMYLLFAKDILPLLGLSDDIELAIAFKLGFSILIIAGLIISKKSRAVGLVPSVNIKVLPIFWPLLALIVWQFSQVSSLPAIDVIVKLVVMALLIGFIEEVIFRGVIFHWMRNLPTIRIILYSSIIFGLAHGINALQGDDVKVVFLQIIVAFSIGLILAVARAKDKSLVLVIIIHSLIDFSEYIGKGIDVNKNYNQDTMMMWLAPGIIFLFWGLFLIFKMARERRA